MRHTANAPSAGPSRTLRRPTVLGALALVALSVGASASRAESAEDGKPAGSQPVPAFAFEWAGVYPLPEGVTDLVLQPGPDASIDVALVPVANDSGAAFEEAVAASVRIFAGAPKPLLPGEEFSPGPNLLQLRVEGDAEMRFPVRVGSAGLYALFTQHFADEFQTVFETGGQRTTIPAAPAFAPEFTAPARVAFDMERMAHVGPAVSGRIAALPARHGDAVQEGDVLLVVDSAELGEAQGDYLLKRAAVGTAAPAVDLARGVHERARRLHEDSQGVSLTEVERRLAELQAAVSTLRIAEAAAVGEANRLRLLGMDDAEIKALEEEGRIAPRHTLRSPIAGRIIRRDATIGEIVGPDRAPLLLVADTTRLRVLVDVPERRLGDLAPGTAVRFTVATHPGVVFGGTVSIIGPDIDHGTRTAQVRVDVDNGDGRLLPGMVARAEIRGRDASAVAIPGSANRSEAPGGRASVVGGRRILPQATRNFRDRFGQIAILPSAQRAFGVRVEPARGHTFAPAFTVPARVAYDPERTALVGAPVAGRVVAIEAREGDAVGEGAGLLVVDSPALGEAQGEFLRLRTAVDATAPAVELARGAHERARRLHEESRGLSLAEVERRQAESLAAESALRVAEAAVAGAANRLRLLGMDEAALETLAVTGRIVPRYTVRSALAGRVIRRSVTLGEMVGPDREALLVIADTGRLRLRADVPETRLRDLSPGAAVRFTVASVPGAAFDGSVASVGAAIDPATRTAEVRVEVDNGDGRLRPGMFAEAEIRGRVSASLAVPVSAVQSVEGKPVVFVPLAGKPDTFLKRPVTLGRPEGGLLPVIHGLVEGEPFVSSGSFILKAELGKSSAKHAH
jgi:cobalt-zinc-cadmium efflux system membrane fusion protein